jgi:hypothetical protein
MKSKDGEEEKENDENRTNLRLETRIRSHSGLVIAFELDGRALHPVGKTKEKVVQRTIQRSLALEQNLKTK